MAKKQTPFGRTRVVFCRTSLQTKCIVLATLVVTTAVLLTLTFGIRSANAATAEAREKAAALEQENREYEEKIDGMGSVEGNKALAEDYFGLVDPDTVVFTPAN